MNRIQKFHFGRFYTATTSEKNWYELIGRDGHTLTFRVRKAHTRSETWKQVVTSIYRADEKGAFETVRFSDETILRADRRSRPVPGFIAEGQE